jgi:outer membrane protein assembly factor BamB
LRESIIFYCLILITIFIFAAFGFVYAEDWPTYMHDNERSGTTSELIKAPLYLQWQYSTLNQPQPAWPAPAKTDFWHRETNLKPRVIFDRAYHVVSAENLVYFGSSTDDKIYCLDAATGEEKWSFFCEGPIRLAPTIWEDLVLAGSDDGNVYALNSVNGALKWKINTNSNERLIIGNERMISTSPVRTGILVYDNTVYFGAGIFPNEGVSLYAVEAKTGKIVWKRSNLDLSPQGFLLASHDKLYIPTGRTTPQIFDRHTGKEIGTLNGEHGGTYALLNDNTLVYGGGDLGMLEYKANDQMATFNGLQMLIAENKSYLRTEREISAIWRKKYIQDYKNLEEITKERSELADKLWDLREKRQTVPKNNLPKIDAHIESLITKIEQVSDRQKNLSMASLVWKLPVESTSSMILAGSSLIIGGDGTLYMVDSADGEIVWTGEVEGKVYGLAYANGHLYVSTDMGRIYCFSPHTNEDPQFINPEIINDPYPGNWFFDEYSHAADKIINRTKINKGYCLIIDVGEGRLAYELARKTDLQIIGFEDDVAKVKIAREKLHQAGLYGTRITIQHGPLDKLPYTKLFANLIVLGNPESDDSIVTPADEVIRVLKPYGGTAYIGTDKLPSEILKQWTDLSTIKEWRTDEDGHWAILQKGAQPNAGSWTHLYANPGNTASSIDQIQAPLQIQWFGRPGPRKMINRHSRPMSTLFNDGRLFIPADNRVIVVDAYNGTLIWESEIPDSRILGALKDFGHMVVTNDLLYVAVSDECRGMDVENGNVRVTLKMPNPGNDTIYNWGYLATSGDQIFGSAKKNSASFTILGRFNCDDFEGDFREMVLSDYLFSLNRNTGKVHWTYQNGVVFNNTITISEDHIYFVESRNDKSVSDIDGRLRVDYFCNNETYLIKMDKISGKIAWQKPVHFPFEQIMYLSYADNIVLATGSYNKGKYVNYALYAFDAASGEKIWENSFRGGNTRWQTESDDETIGGSHGEQWQHPVIIDNTIYLPPHNFDLHTGRQGNLYLTRGGHGCGGLSGSAHNLFARGSNPRIYELADGDQSGKPITKVNRPGCWINIIPAGGLLSIPESSSGCTCSYPVQTSFVFVPVGP